MGALRMSPSPARCWWALAASEEEVHAALLQTAIKKSAELRSRGMAAERRRAATRLLRSTLLGAQHRVCTEVVMMLRRLRRRHRASAGSEHRRSPRQSAPVKAPPDSGEEDGSAHCSSDLSDLVVSLQHPSSFVVTQPTAGPRIARQSRQTASAIGADLHGLPFGSFASLASGMAPPSGSATPQLHPGAPSSRSTGSMTGPSWASRGSSGRENVVAAPVSSAVVGSRARAPLSDDLDDEKQLSLHSGMSDLQGLGVEEPGISGLSMQPPAPARGGTLTHEANFLPWHRRPETVGTSTSSRKDQQRQGDAPHSATSTAGSEDHGRAAAVVKL